MRSLVKVPLNSSISPSANVSREKLYVTAIMAVGQCQMATVAFPTKQRVSKVEHLSTGCMRYKIYIEIYVRGIAGVKLTHYSHR
jgi:hypothetical protein